MADASVRRRGHGEDAIYFAADKNRYVGEISLGFGPDGKRLRRKVVCDGVKATRLLREREPARVVVLTTYADDQSVLEEVRAGARGYLTKDASGPQVRETLHQVLTDHAAIDSAV